MTSVYVKLLDSRFSESIHNVEGITAGDHVYSVFTTTGEVYRFPICQVAMIRETHPGRPA